MLHCPDLVIAVMQAHDVRACARQHDIDFLQQVGGIVRRDYFHGHLHAVRSPLRSVHCPVGSVGAKRYKSSTEYKERGLRVL